MNKEEEEIQIQEAIKTRIEESLKEKKEKSDTEKLRRFIETKKFYEELEIDWIENE